MRLGLPDRDLKWLSDKRILLADSQTSNGWALYSEAQVRTLEARKLDGTLFLDMPDKGVLTMPAQLARPTAVEENSARVFEMLYNGIPPHLIVIQTKLSSAVVDQIRHDYDRMSGAMSIPQEVLDRMNAMKRLNGRFPLRSPADVLEVFQLADNARLCTTCRRVGASSECGGCVYQRAETDVKERVAAERATAAAEPQQPQRPQRPSQTRVQSAADDSEPAVAERRARSA